METKLKCLNNRWSQLQVQVTIICSAIAQLTQLNFVSHSVTGAQSACVALKFSVSQSHRAVSFRCLCLCLCYCQKLIILCYGLLLRLVGDGKRDCILSTNFSHRPFLLDNILPFASVITDNFVSRGE